MRSINSTDWANDRRAIVLDCKSVKQHDTKMTMKGPKQQRKESVVDGFPIPATSPTLLSQLLTTLPHVRRQSTFCLWRKGWKQERELGIEDWGTHGPCLLCYWCSPTEYSPLAVSSPVCIPTPNFLPSFKILSFVAGNYTWPSAQLILNKAVIFPKQKSTQGLNMSDEAYKPTHLLLWEIFYRSEDKVKNK
jgi:hypothetical protein